jgi:hypothetical protein
LRFKILKEGKILSMLANMLRVFVNLIAALGCAILGWAFLFDAWRDVKEAHRLRKQAM